MIDIDQENQDMADEMDAMDSLAVKPERAKEHYTSDDSSDDGFFSANSEFSWDGSGVPVDEFQI